MDILVLFYKYLGSIIPAKKRLDRDLLKRKQQVFFWPYLINFLMNGGSIQTSDRHGRGFVHNKLTRNAIFQLKKTTTINLELTVNCYMDFNSKVLKRT